ncbi:hypothetical protein MTP99_006077 [Tenebrio molitor]|nr:hypothetical protein MTP99_006077 [Tenebrio molitor]
MFPIFIFTTYESIRDTTFIFHGQLRDTNFDLNFCWLSADVRVPVGEAPPPPSIRTKTGITSGPWKAYGSRSGVCTLAGLPPHNNNLPYRSNGVIGSCPNPPTL